MPENPDQQHVVIVGGGPAGVEALMALRDLAEDRVRVTLVAPHSDLEIKPLRTAVPFSVDHVRHYPLKDVAQRWGADLVAAELTEVRPSDQTVLLSSGDLSYDALILAVGARATPAYPAEVATMFGHQPSDQVVNGLLADVEGGFTKSVAFVVPPGVAWPLPLYELALMTASEVWSMGITDAQIMLVTPEDAPLAIFGPQASHAVHELLQQARIAFRGGVYAQLKHKGQIELRPGSELLPIQRVVALPLLEGPSIPGLPKDDHGFLPIDDHGSVIGVENVYAAGDAANFPVKQGGLACQQADAAAHLIAYRAGAPVNPEPFHPVLRGKLLTGHGAQYLRTALHGGAGESKASDIELWWPPTKISGHYLSRWLTQYAPQDQELAQPGHTSPRPPIPPPSDPASPAIDVEVALPSPQQIRSQAMSLDPYSFPAS